MMALSNKHGWLVLTTGNKSEMSVGYATLYGDMAGGFAVIKDVPKTLVYELVATATSARAASSVPASVIERAPSAELRPDQLDSDSLPPYELLDRILEAYVERDRAREEMIAAGCPAEVVDEVIQHGRPLRVQAPPGGARDPDHAARPSAATGACRSPTASAASRRPGAAAPRSVIWASAQRRSSVVARPPRPRPRSCGRGGGRGRRPLIAPSVIGRMKLTLIDWPIATIPSSCTASAVAREQTLSTSVDIRRRAGARTAGGSVADLEPRRARVGAASSSSMPRCSTPCGVAFVGAHRAQPIPVPTPNRVSDAGHSVGFRAPSGAHARPTSDAAAAARARAELRRPRLAARRSRNPRSRSRARAALAELGGADRDRSGRAHRLPARPGRPDRPRRRVRATCGEDAADHELATTLVERLREMFPAAELPRLPGEPRSGAPPAGPPVPVRSRTRGGLGHDVAGTVGALAVADAADRDRRQRRRDRDRDRARDHRRVRRRRRSTASEPTSTEHRPPRASTSRSSRRPEAGRRRQRRRRGRLRPRNGRPALRRRLDRGPRRRRPQDETYVVWLMLTPRQGLSARRRSRSQQNGSFQDRFSIPSAVLPVVARVRYVDVSIAPVTAIRKLVRGGDQEHQPGPRRARRRRCSAGRSRRPRRPAAATARARRLLTPASRAAACRGS